MKYLKALISDADGTLVDTTYVIRHGQYESSKIYLTKYGIPTNEIPNYETYEKAVNQVVGRPVRETLEKTLQLIYKDKPNYLDNLDYDEILRILKRTQDDMVKSSTVGIYDGFLELMKTLSEQRIKFAIFTSGSPHHIVRNFGVSLPQLGLENLHKDESMSDAKKLDIFIKTFARYFNIPSFTVVTAVDTTKHKPDPDGLHIAIQRLNVKPSECIFLGDQMLDMQVADNAKVEERIGITHGFNDRSELEDNGATNVIESLGELIKLLRS